MENEIYIRELLVKEHFGLITEEEQLQLDAILATNEEVLALRNEIQSLPKDAALEHMRYMDDNAGLQNLFQLHHQRRSRRTRNRWIASSCIIAGIVLAGVYFSRISQTPVNTAAILQTNSTATGSATLQLASGKIIHMNDSGMQSIVAEHATLNNDNRVLSIQDQSGSAEGWNTLTVPPKLDYQLKLSDGTHVWLNSTSKIRFPFAFTGKYREVYVEGEAYFNVKKDATHPFIVHAGQADVLVLGTDFNINAYTPARVVTSLVSGKVSINEKILQPGKQAVVATGKPVQIQDFDMENTLSWRQGIHYFRNASIRELATMLSRWHDVQLVIDNPEVAEVHMRGKLFRHEPLQSFLDQLNATGTVHFYWEGKVLHCK